MFVICAQGELPPLAEVDEILAFIEKIGADQVALDGGFVAPDIEGSEKSSSATNATAAGAAAAAPSAAVAAT